MLQTQNWKIETKKCRSHWQPIKIIPYMQSRMLRLYNTQVTTSLFIFITYHSIGYNFQPQSFAWFTLLLYPCWPVNISFSPSSNSCSISYTILCFFFVFFLPHITRFAFGSTYMFSIFHWWLWWLRSRGSLWVVSRCGNGLFLLGYWLC